jgi:hypothetical protein
MSQQEQENMLSTILEASCEDATPMTSLVDVHQQRLQPSSSPPPLPMSEDEYTNDSEDETEMPVAPSFAAIDNIPVSTAFSKNESKLLL